MKGFLLSLALLIAPSGNGQKANNVKDLGDCSVVIVGNRNSISCGVLTKEEAAQLASILNEVRQSKLDLGVVSNKLEEILAEIRRSENPNLAVFSYDPDGSKRTTAAGIIRTDPGESPIYSQMYSAEKQGRWQQEAALAEEEKRKVPNWLMPLFLAGNAYKHLCNVEQAESNWREFYEKATSQPAYSQWIELTKERIATLSLLREQCRHSNP